MANTYMRITGRARQGQCRHFNTLHSPWKKSCAFVSVSKQSSLLTQNQSAMLFTRQTEFISRQITGRARQGQCRHFNTLHSPWKKSCAFVSVSNQSAMLFTKQQDIAKTDPVKGDLVYFGTVTKMIRIVKGFSLSTSAIGLVMLPFILEKALSAKPVLGIISLLLSNVFIFITPVLNHIVTKRFVTKIYLKRDEGVFTATTYSFFLREKEHKFKASDVTVPKIPRMLTSLKIHGKTPLFIESDFFIDKSAFVQMMKYDKPLDWEITDKKGNKKVEKTN